MKYYAGIIFFLFFVQIVNAQSTAFTLKGISLDRIIDAKSISLGESCVADPVSPSSYVFNPANLSEIKGTNLFYNFINRTWYDNAKYVNSDNTAGLVANTSIGGFMLSVSSTKFNIEHAMFGGTKLEVFTSSVSLGYAREIIKNLSAGIAVKNLYFSSKMISASNTSDAKTDRDLNLLGDFGLLYRIDSPLIGNESRVKDRLYLGASVQNIPLDLKSKIPVHIISRGVNNYDYTTDMETAEYMRLGFSYGFIIPTELSENTLELVLSGEYKNLINPGSEEKAMRDNYGAGFEVKFMDIIAINLGGVMKNELSDFYERGKFKLNLGLSIDLPLKYINKNLPFKIGFDYTNLFMNQDAKGSSEHLPVFNLWLSYDGNLF